MELVNEARVIQDTNSNCEGETMSYYTIRRIGIMEMRRLHMAHPDWADTGWAVVKINGNTETVLDWYADKHAAFEEAMRLEEEQP